MLLLLLLLLLSGLSVVTGGDGCHSDRDKDHRPRVSCVDQGLTAVPDGIDPGTQVLVFSQNQFSSLSWTSYSTFSELHELDLSVNTIRTIDQSGPALVNLRVLRLTNNEIASLRQNAFGLAPALMEVYLDGNGLHSLNEVSFGGLQSLEVINLSRNKIQVLPPRLLEHITSNGLKTFDLEDNQIQQLPDGFFTSKPELPYVYLSHNPWVCSCMVGYLQSYLEDQGHNVYKHTGSNSVENDPESVVCSAPAGLQGRAIVDLTTDDYCSETMTVSMTFKPKYHLGDIDPDLLYVSTAQPFTQPITALIPMTKPSVTTIPTTSEQTTTTEEPPVTRPYIPTTTTELTTTQQMTTKPATAAPVPTVRPTTSTSLSQTTTPSALPSTVQPTTTAPPANPTPLTTIEPIIPTTVLSSFWTRLESWTFRYVWTFRTEHYITNYNISNHITSRTPTTATPDPVAPPSTPSPTLAPPPAGDISRYGGTRGSVPWCWWLFISFLLLCILSAIFSCILFIWLIFTYITLYRPIKRQNYSANGVTLMAYQATAGEVMPMHGVEEDQVPFLAPEMIRHVQPVFRSVLIISKGAEEEGGGGEMMEDGREKPGNDATTKIELVPAATRRDGAEVFRKTLYRMISREEEIEGWTEVEESRWGVAEGRKVKRDGAKTRYSLILREDRGSTTDDRTAGAEWVVGEWEMGGGGGGRGRNRESWGSLIRSMDRWGLPDSAHTSTPQEVAETQV